MQLLILRHAETWANVEGRMQGDRDLHLRPGQFCELTPRGKDQAIALGQRLASYPPPTQIHLSPLRRAWETWACFPPPLTCVPACSDPLLCELNQGIFSGLTWAEATFRHPELCQRLMEQSRWIPVPQAESPEQARSRAERWLQAMALVSTDSDRVWILTHGGFIPYLVSALLGSDRTWGISVELTALFEFEMTLSLGDKALDRHHLSYPQIKHFNDASHWDASHWDASHWDASH